MSLEIDNIHYLIRTWTQTQSHSGTDAKVTIRLHGEKGRTVFVRLNNEHDNFEKGHSDAFSEHGFEDVGAVYRVDVHVGDDAWRPEKIEVSHLKSGNTTTFINSADVSIKNATHTLQCEELIDIDVNGSNSSTTDNWMVFDYRGSSTDQDIKISKSSQSIKKAVSQTDSEISTQTGLRVLNTSSVEAGGEIGPKVSSSLEVEFNAQLSTAIKKSKVLESTSDISIASSFSFSAPAATLLFVNYPVHAEYKTGKVKFFNGSHEDVVIPQYDQWSLDDIPARRVEVTSDSEMTDELKKVFQEFFGHTWKSEPYKTSENNNLRVAS